MNIILDQDEWETETLTKDKHLLQVQVQNCQDFYFGTTKSHIQITKIGIVHVYIFPSGFSIHFSQEAM